MKRLLVVLLGLVLAVGFVACGGGGGGSSSNGESGTQPPNYFQVAVGN